MGELVQFRTGPNGIETRPIAKAAEPWPDDPPTNTAIWQCGPCASGRGNCCTRKAETLPPAAKAVVARAERTDSVGARESYLKAELAKLKEKIR